MEDISVFDIPLLNREVTQHLSKHDLAQCCLVSKQWHEWFTPALWHSIKLPCPENAFEAIRRNQNHVRNILVFGLPDAVAPWDCWSFPALQSITFISLHWRTSSHKMLRFEMKMLRLLETSPFLRSLNVNLSLNNLEVYNQLLHTLLPLHHLQKVKLTCDGYVNPVHWQQIIENCRHCESIDLTLRASEDLGIEGEGKYALAKSDFEKMPDTRLRELFFEFHSSKQQTRILSPLIRCSPLLKSLRLKERYCDMSVKHLSDTFQSMRNLRLKKLHLEHLYGSDCDIADLLRSIGSGDDKDDSDMEQLGLDALEQRSYVFGQESALALTKYHAKTLATLEFLRSQVEFQLFVCLMSGLPMLLSFRLLVLFLPRTTDIAELDQILTKPWVCRKLRYLRFKSCLCYDDIKSTRDQNWGGSLRQRTTKYLYSQIGELEDLEELGIEDDIDVLLLEDGYLDFLSNLKSLKEISIYYHDDSRMAAREAEWMVVTWPRLARFFVKTRCRQKLLRTIHQALDPFEKAMLEKKPSIQFHRR